MRIDRLEVQRFLNQNDKFAILCHANPDGDTLGSGYALCRALQKAGKQSKVFCGDEISNRYEYLKTMVLEMDFAPEYIISVDVADEKLLGTLEGEYRGRIDLAIDHHSSNTMYAKNTLLESSASNAEIIYEVIMLLGVEIDSQMAAAIYTGISTDTGCFRYPNTTPRSHYIAAKLMECDYDFGRLNYLLFEAKTKERLKLESDAAKSIEYYFDGKFATLALTAKLINTVDPEDINGISGILRQIYGVEAGATFKEKEPNVWKVSLRSNSYLNVQEVCKVFGGGGHLRAAGCKMNGTFGECKTRLLAEIEKHIK